MNEDSNTLETRSEYPPDPADPAIFSQYNTKFIDIETIPAPLGNSKMTAYINTYPDGVIEYDFELQCKIKNNLHIVFWIGGAQIMRENGRHVDTLYGVSGQKMEFTLKFLSPRTVCHLAIENQIGGVYQEAEARLVFVRARYNGQPVYAPIPGIHDMNVYARYLEGQGSGSTEYHWICNTCGNMWSLNNTRCPRCD